jgi:hypothetical protein
VHHHGTHPQMIFSPCQKDGELFQRFHGGVYRESQNAKADELAKAAACNTSLSADIFLQVISDASIKTVELEPRVINLI